MARRTKMHQVIDLLEEILNDHYFHPALFANIIITSYPPYTQEKLVHLINYINEYHQEELAIDKAAKTGKYRNDNPPRLSTDNSWLRDTYHGPSAHMNVQAFI